MEDPRPLEQRTDRLPETIQPQRFYRRRIYKRRATQETDRGTTTSPLWKILGRGGRQVYKGHPVKKVLQQAKFSSTPQKRIQAEGEKRAKLVMRFQLRQRLKAVKNKARETDRQVFKAL